MNLACRRVTMVHSKEKVSSKLESREILDRKFWLGTDLTRRSASAPLTDTPTAPLTSWRPFLFLIAFAQPVACACPLSISFVHRLSFNSLPIARALFYSFQYNSSRQYNGKLVCVHAPNLNACYQSKFLVRIDFFSLFTV